VRSCRVSSIIMCRLSSISGAPLLILIWFERTRVQLCSRSVNNCNDVVPALPPGSLISQFLLPKTRFE
jgi:hypothetical protein